MSGIEVMVSTFFSALWCLFTLIFVRASSSVEACILGPQPFVVSDGTGTKAHTPPSPLADLASTTVEESIFPSSSVYLFYFHRAVGYWTRLSSSFTSFKVEISIQATVLVSSELPTSIPHLSGHVTRRAISCGLNRESSRTYFLANTTSIPPIHVFIKLNHFSSIATRRFDSAE